MTNHRGNAAGTQRGNTEPFYVTLPYDFVSFAAEAHFPYDRADLPKHDCKDKNRLSGRLDYTITPCSDLAVEVREKKGGDYFACGSQIRGRIRANLEILSAGYPQFIERSPMLYRDFTGNLKGRYQERMGIKSGKSLEQAVQAGFLKKDGNEFYVVEADKMGNKNFLSIKEHRLLDMGLSKLLKMGLDRDESFSTIFNWDEDGDKQKEFNQLQSCIEAITEKIRSQREQLADNLKYQEQISALFINKYSFTKELRTINKKLKKNPGYNYKTDLSSIKEKLSTEIQAIIPSAETELMKLYQLTADRWQIKAKLYIEYRLLEIKQINNNFFPYQRRVYYRTNASGYIQEIVFEAPENNKDSEDSFLKAYLFNSTNVGSKRSHYLVRGPVADARRYPVSPAVISDYRQYLKKFRTEKETKNFYDIFNSYEELQKEDEDQDGIIVFFQLENEESGNSEVCCIGRTPYFKIPYKHQLEQLIGAREKDKVDYAQALFGFIPDDIGGDGASKAAYKSRLRFSPVDIILESGVDGVKFGCVELLLSTPYPYNSAMYLQQDDGSELQTYEQNEQLDHKPRLNGYKYYHILQQPIKARHQKKTQNMSRKKTLKGDDIVLQGKIYFHNLSEAELGLLLLSVEVKQLRESEKYRKIISEYKVRPEKTYELLGGAKAYGYGKVEIEIKSLEIEKNGNDFASLVENPMQPIDRECWRAYIDAFIDAMGGRQYFDKVHFEQYLQSKLEIPDPGTRSGNGAGEKNNPRHIHWTDRELNTGGYNKEWRLRKNFFLYKNAGKVIEKNSVTKTTKN